MTSEREPPWRRAWPLVATLVLGTTGGLFLALTWGGWLDPLVDFGRELYVPWRILEKERLGVELAWFNGPLSVHLNALVFAVAGVGLKSLVGANLVLLAAVAFVLVRELAALAGRGPALASGLLFLSVFAFGQYTGIGNYNWVTPYSHELTHGVALGLFCLASLRTAFAGGPASPARRLWLPGLFLGLAFLTKPEVFLATFVAAASWLWLERARLRARDGLVFFVALVGSCGLAAAALVLVAGASPKVLAGAWPYLFRSEVGQLLFYKRGMGFDEPGLALFEIGRWLLAWAAVLLPALIVARIVRTRGQGRIAAAFAFAGGVAALELLWRGDPGAPWLMAIRPLPLVLALFCGVLFLRPRCGDPDEPGSAPGPDARRVQACAWCLFSLLLLAKILLRVRSFHYGFALAMPAAVLTFALALGWLPTWLARRGFRGEVVAGLCLGVGAAFAELHVGLMRQAYEVKTLEVGQGADRFRTDERGLFLIDVAAALDRELEADGTVVVLPEGVTLNYFNRRRNPTPYVNFMPPEFALFGEEAMLAAFRSTPPDAIVVVHKDTREYGLPFFGSDYGRRLYAWVQRNYKPVGQWGDPPLEPGSKFGARLYLRR